MSKRTKKLILIELYLLTLITWVKCMDIEQDNQLVALEDDENNNINNLNQANEFERINSTIICKVPKYPPYIFVTRVTRTEIEFNITDINDESYNVEGYTVYYWGFKLGPKSSYRSEDRHFGHKSFTKEGPFVITNLKPKFSFCADIVAINKCGHSPFCNGCFEQVITL